MCVCVCVCVCARARVRACARARQRPRKIDRASYQARNRFAAWHQTQHSQTHTHTHTHLRLDVLERALNLGDNDVFNGVDTTLRCLDDLVECSKRCLQRPEVNQHLDCRLPLLLALLNRLATLAKTRQLVGCTWVR
jgi:hypothetical protein